MKAPTKPIATMKSNSNIHPVYKSRVKSLEETLTHIAGVPVEITIRAIDHYTFTFDGRHDKAMSKLQAFFLGKLNGCGYDQECNMSYAYYDA